jgi:predicted  nucleic acid-binding Zn-ribbon protein
MSNDFSKGDALRLRTLEAEVLTLNQRLDQRERLLKTLNRRLLELERGENGAAGAERAATSEIVKDIQTLQEHNQRLQEELDRLYRTKLFRWANPARTVYSRLRSTT